MRQKKITKKYRKKERRIKFVLILISLIFFVLFLLLFYRAFFVKRPIFISPLSNIGFEKNSKLEQMLKDGRIEYLSIKYKKDYYLITLKDNGQVFISESKDYSVQFSSLQLILKRLKIEGKRFKSLDFRYSNPVILF